MEEKPFVHLFETPKNQYIYDFNTNAILRVNDSIYNSLKNNNTENILEDLDVLKRSGFLKKDHWKKIEHPSSRFFETYLKGSLKSITLQVTQQCNLRCHYCPYSGSYYNREHNNKKMSLEMSKEIVDFYIMHSYDIPELQFGFYGGEPLLEFELIKKIITYIEKRAFGKKVSYRMTTNATLLTEEIVDYLVDKKFILTISLDGPKEYHNRNRLNVNDKGTFDVVMKNIEMIQQRHPEAVDFLAFNCVIDPKNDLKYLNDFFQENDILNNHLVMFNKIAREGIKDENAYIEDEAYQQRYSYEHFKLLYSKTYKDKGIEVSHIVTSYYEQLKRDIWERGTSSLVENSSHPGGPCLTGCHKLFVNIYGSFYPCERVSECSNDMKIGNISTGFDYDKARHLLNIAQLTEGQCIDCWAAKFCFLCAQHADTGSGISRDKKLQHCSGVRFEVEELLKDYCLICEKNGFKEDTVYLTEVHKGD